MSDFPSAIAVGDHFIPSGFYVEALQRFAPNALAVDVRELGGSKKRQHQDQQVMERRGPNATEFDPDLVLEMRKHDFVIVHFAPVPAEVFAPAGSTRGVFAARAGVENIDVVAATEAGVPVFNVQGRNASAVAELALGLMLAEARNIARADRSVKNGQWRKDFPHTPVEIGGSTIGLVGYGHVGRELARRLRGFEAHVLVFDPFVERSVVEAEDAELVELESIFTESDFISLQARLTSETHEMIDARLIGMMKPTAYLVNVARSRLVNTGDLLDALESGRIAGAGLDVFDEEPLPGESRFRQLDNVTLTTHFGGDTETTNRRSAELVAQALSSYVSSGDASEAVNASDLGS